MGSCWNLGLGKGMKSVNEGLVEERGCELYIILVLRCMMLIVFVD